MRDLEFDVCDVLEALGDQLLTHSVIVEEAWKGYKEQAEKELRAALARIEVGERAAVTVVVRAPEDHTKEIERAIEMLEMAENEMVVLDEQEFACYVQGQWEWMRSFLASNSRYSATAARSDTGHLR